MAARTRIPLKKRLLTVGRSFYAYTYTHRHHNRRLHPPVPYLRLRGHWLRQAGFAIGQKVDIHIGDGRITIVPIASS